jgi:autotransporter-associated beta strand protein
MCLSTHARHLGLSLVALAFAAVAPPQAHGQTFTWNNFGGTAFGGNLLWGSNNNWSAAPTFGQNTTLVFPNSPLMVNQNYASTVDIVRQVNSLVFGLNGPNGVGLNSTLDIALGETEVAFIRFSPSSTGVAPSLVQNGSGSVNFRTVTNFSLIVLDSNLTVSGTGIGMVQIGSQILTESGVTPTSNITVNFDPSAVRANNTGASLYLSGNNQFTGNVILTNGNLGIGSATALGAATNQLIVNAGSNSVRVVNSPVIPNPIVLNSTMTVTSYDGSGTAQAFTGAWSGAGGLTFRPGVGSTYAIRGAAGFTGPLVMQPLTLGLAGTANNLTLNVGSTATTTGTLATTNVQLFAGSVLNLDNVTANVVNRMATGTNLTMNRSTFSLTANATAGNDAAQTINSLTNTGMSTLLAGATAATSSSITIGTWNRVSNSTAYFLAPGLGGAAAANVGVLRFVNNPGGATPGSTTAGTQNLAVLPYAFGNSSATVTGTAATGLVRYDAATGRIVLLNTATEYATNFALANGTGAAGLNYRLTGAGSGGVYGLAGNVALNGLVLDSNMTAPAPTAGVALVGAGTLTLTGPVLSTYSGTGFPTGISTFLPNQIAVTELGFGANTAYFHTLGDLWVRSPITGSGGVVKSADNGSGQANLYLLAPNTFTGGLTINAGNVYFTTDANLGAAGGGILMNSGGNGGLMFAQDPFYSSTPAANPTIDRPLAIGTANGTLGTALANNVLTYSGLITGAGGLVMQNGVVSLTNAGNTFTGDVMLRNGTTVVAADGALGAATNRILMGVPLATAVFQPAAGYTSTDRDFLILNSGNSIFTNGVDFTINGTLASTQAQVGGPPGLNKGGLGTLTLTAFNTLGGAIVIGDTGLRLTAPNQVQFGGALRLAGANGALPHASGFAINDGAVLILDNTLAVNNDRIGNVSINLGPNVFGGGSFTLIGNTGANVLEQVGGISTTGGGTVTLSQPTSAGGQVTELNANALTAGTTGTLFVRGTNLGAAAGDRTRLIVTPANITTSLIGANGIVVGVVTAASDSSAPTDFLSIVANTNPIPNAPRYVLAPLATYGSLAAPGAAVTANQAGAVFPLTAATSLNALRIGTDGGLDLGTQTLTLGTATANAQSGMILSAGGPNAGIINGTITYGSQTARFITSTDLTVGTAANPTALVGTGQFIKSGPGTLTLFGTAGTTLGSAGLNVLEGRLVLGNAAALGRSTLNATSVAPIPNVYAFTTVQRGGTLDVSPLAGAPVRINTIAGAGNLALGDAQVYTGLSSSTLAGNITGTANSKFFVGIPQADIPLNTFGGGGPTLTGDNSGFLGQWVVLRGTLRFDSNLSFGTGTSPILLGDTAFPTSTGTTSLNLFSSLTVPFPRDVVVQANPSPAGVPVLLVGNSNNVSMTGSLTLNRSLAVSGNPGSIGVFTFAGAISGVGQLQLGSSVFSGSGNVTFATANPDWSGGVLMNTGNSTANLSGVVGVAADTSLGTGTLTLGAGAGLIRADGGARTLANPIVVANTTPTAAFTTSFGSTGVNNLTFTGNVTGSASSVPATPFTHTLNLNVINQGTTSFAGTVGNGAAFNLGLTKNGFGTLLLGGNNTYTGDTVLNAGRVILNHPNALGVGGRQGMTNVSGAVVINSGAVLDLNGQSPLNKPVTMAGGYLINNGASPVVISGGTLASLTMTATGGSTYTAPPDVTLTGGGGTGATAVASLGLTQASLVFAPLTGGGTGYSAPPTVSITGGGGSGATATASLGVTSQTFTITNGGSGYTAAPTVTIGGGGGTGATATATITGGVVTSITITSPGTGFTFTPTITFGAAPAGGTTATGIGNATNFQVGGVTLTNPGGGFTSAPDVTFTGGGGTGATATTTAANFALGLVVTNPGSGYTTAPTVTFSTGTATATANLSTIALASGANAIGGSGLLTVNAPISGAGGLVKIGTGTAILTGTNTYTGGTTISAGVLQVGVGGTTGTLGTGAVVNNASLVFNRSDAVIMTTGISGTGAVTQAGAGALYLNGANTYTGGTTVAAGTLGGTGSVASGVTVATGATIRGGNAAGAGTVTLGGGVTLAPGANFAIQILSGSTPAATGSGGSSGGTATAPANNNFILVSAGGITADPTTLNYRVDGTGVAWQYQSAYSFRVAQSVGQDLSGVVITDPSRFTFTNFALDQPRDVSLTGDAAGVLHLNFTPVPEPAAVGLVAAAVLGLGAAVRPFRRRATATDSRTPVEPLDLIHAKGREIAAACAVLRR